MASLKRSVFVSSLMLHFVILRTGKRLAADRIQARLSGASVMSSIVSGVSSYIRLSGDIAYALLMARCLQFSVVLKLEARYSIPLLLRVNAQNCNFLKRLTRL